MNWVCSPSEKTQNSCGYLSIHSSLAVICTLQDRGMISQSGIDLFKETMFNDAIISQPGFIQALNEWKSQGCSL